MKNKTSHLFQIGICIFILLSSTVLHAQNKPSKEETIAFMNRTLQSAVGSVFGITVSEEGKKLTAILTNNHFDGNTSTTSNTDEKGTLTVNYSSFHWETLTDVKDQEETSSQDGILTMFAVVCTFSVPFRWVIPPEPSHYNKTIKFYVPKEKAESFRKALFRLSEITKQENKDPFAN